MKLLIGNKNYSSWSLRAWLFISYHGLEFEEVRICLGRQETPTEIRRHSPAGKVPALIDDELLVWDSLAICEYISETYLEGRGWPADRDLRAQARACSAEMHSGFFHLREDMPMNCRATGRTVEISAPLGREIRRIDTLWSELLGAGRESGDWLFGDFSIADCMFAPVVFRFTTYGVTVSDAAAMYMERILSLPPVKLWAEAARQEQEIIEMAEKGM